MAKKSKKRKPISNGAASVSKAQDRQPGAATPAAKAQAKPAAPAAKQASRPDDKGQGAPRGSVSTKPVGRLRTFFREVRVEMTKVTWPPRKELIKSTGVVIVAVTIAAVFIWGFDSLWQFIVETVGMGG